MTSLCYPNVMQSILDEYCRMMGRPTILFEEGAEEALKQVMQDGTPADYEALSLRRNVIARLSYYCRRSG